MSEQVKFSDGVIQHRCTWCSRIYISKNVADNCCKGMARPRQVEIDGNFYYYGIEYK